MEIEQRWLLWHMGGWQIIQALCSPEGVADLMRSRWGSTGGGRDIPDGAPAWLNGCGWDTESSTISPKWIDGRPGGAPKFTIKPAAINRYAKALPEDIKKELLDCRRASTENAVLRGRFCRCGTKPCGYAYMKDRICPPTEEQENEADAEYWRIRDWEDELLVRALGLRADDQLELFEVAS